MHLQILWFLSMIIWNMKMQNANLFFYFKDNKVCGSLDNPLLDDMNSVKNLGNQLFFSIYLDGKSTYKV